MSPTRACRVVAVIVPLFAAPWGTSRAAEPENLLASRGLASPAPNSADEPLAGAFSLDNAVKFLDAASLEWQQSRGCVTCHTNSAYLFARPSLPGDARNHATVRAFAEQLIEKRWPEKGPRWDAEVIVAAAALAYNDAATTGRLHPATRTALDRMWTLQRPDGGWNWLKCDWPPMESDDHYGATLAAIATGVAPDAYASTSQATTGLSKLKRYLAANPPPTVHHRAMLLWAASYLPDLMTEEARRHCIQELTSLQRPDGGWSAASLGDWKRGDDKPQDTATSDGYGTGFTLFALRRGGVPADDPVVLKGVAWIKTHQRASGRWFSRSLFKDNKHFLTHAGTAFALMALRECQSIPAEVR